MMMFTDTARKQLHLESAALSSGYNVISATSGITLYVYPPVPQEKEALRAVVASFRRSYFLIFYCAFYIVK